MNVIFCVELAIGTGRGNPNALSFALDAELVAPRVGGALILVEHASA